MRARKVAPGSFSRPRPPTGELNIFADPSESGKSTERRVRRNSESSIGDRNGKPTEPDDEEKKRQDRRRRERRHREAGKDQKNRKPDRKLDIIDQLDATSIYGTGREFPIIIDSCYFLIRSQFSIMTDLLMLATLIATGKAADELPCKPSQKIH